MASVEGVNPGYSGRVNWFIDSVDDVLLGDGVSSFDGGQFSNLRANLLQQNQSKQLVNTDVDKLGKLRTRRGTTIIGPSTGPQPDPGVTTLIQGLTSYQTSTANYIVAVHNKKLWAFNRTLPTEFNGTWVQIGLGGTADREDIIICRQGQINNPAVVGPPAIPAGYTAGTTVLTVDHVGYVGLTAAGGGTPPAVGADTVAAGEKLYFQNNLRTDYFEYTIKSVNAGTTITITLEDPGLVFDVGDNWIFTVARPAKVKNPTPGNRYAAGATSIAIDTYTGVPGVGENFVIKSENITRTVGAGSTNVLLNFTPGLQANWAASSFGPVVFAQGNDMLYFSDGTGPIYAWKGPIPTSPTVGGGTLMQIGSHSVLDDLAGNYTQSRTKPPQNVRVLVWFQNRLIASGINTEPDAIYFSDFFDGTSWDQDYQKVRIGGGESDPITGCIAWTDLNMVVFKKNSCYLINLDPSQNPDPADPTLLVASFAVKQLHKLIGCPAPLSACQVGGGSTTPGSDIFFVDGDKKVHSIRRVMAAETQQEVGVAMSLPIQDIMDTVNRDYIKLCVGIYHNEHYILGIPTLNGAGAGQLVNRVVAFNLLTQSWISGNWTWLPSCVARRTDLGDYSKFVFGDYFGNVHQWMDDLSLDEEVSTTYQDGVLSNGTGGTDLQTQVLTRAFTIGDFYSFKTGLNVEFEFDESTATGVLVQVILDMVPQTELIAAAFSSSSDPRIRIPFILPITLPTTPGLLRQAFDLQRYGTWRELQFLITTTTGKLAIRSIRLTGFMDTMRLQTIPSAGVPGIGIPPWDGGP